MQAREEGPRSTQEMRPQEEEEELAADIMLYMRTGA